MMRSSNPALRGNVFAANANTSESLDVMTIQGTVNKTMVLLLLTTISAFYAWQNPVIFMPFLMVGAIGGFITAMITIFKKQWSGITAPIYSILEGFVLGIISSFMERSYPGIVVQAVSLTFAVLFCLLMAYKSGVIKATENFKLGVFAATGAIAVVYIIAMILTFFGFRAPLIHETGIAGIVFSLVVVVIASLNLVIDFDFIEKGAEMGAPKYMEWYGAFGLMVTLIWLYLEILRLLAKTRKR